MIGWDMYLTPEQAARGLELMHWLGDEHRCPADAYHDLGRYAMYRLANRPAPRRLSRPRRRPHRPAISV